MHITCTYVPSQLHFVYICRPVECLGSHLTETRHDRNQPLWGDKGCGVMSSQSPGDFLREQCNLVALEEIHGIEFPSTLPTFNPEQYSFPPVLAQTAHLCLLSLLTQIFLLPLFIPPTMPGLYFTFKILSFPLTSRPLQSFLAPSLLIWLLLMSR